MEIQARILRFVTCSNWILFFAASLAGLVVAPLDFTLGIVAGGLIVTVNFHLLARTLKRALAPARLSSHHGVIAKYYMRLLASGVILFFLISGHLVNPLGLFVGLSIVVASITGATVREFTKLIFKEAV